MEDRGNARRQKEKGAGNDMSMERVSGSQERDMDVESQEEKIHGKDKKCEGRNTEVEYAVRKERGDTGVEQKRGRKGKERIEGLGLKIMAAHNAKNSIEHDLNSKQSASMEKI